MASTHTPPPASSGRPPPRRSRARVVVPLLVAAWLVLEIWLISLVGEAAGALAVIGLLLLGGVLGSLVIKRAGARAWRTLTAAVRDGATTLPHSGDTLLVMLGGALLALPGFASDALAVLLLLPPTRALLRRAVPRRLTAGRGPVADAYRQARMHQPDGKVIQGEVIDDERP